MSGPTIRHESPGAIRKRGDAERDRGNWPAASYFYGQLLELEPNDSMLWLQHGHMLKETGLFEAARVSYERALSLRPTDPEVHLQLAILTKIEGGFEVAINRYQEALDLGHPDKEFITTELRFIRKTSGISQAKSPGSGKRTRIFLSCVAQLPSEADSKSLKSFLGGTHYSYAYAMMGFRDALDRAGYDSEIIRNPEYIADIRNGSLAQVHIHLGFYPPDGVRLLKGAHNVMCVAWEFERLKTVEETLSYHSFADAAKMLSCSHEVWMTSDYGADALRRSGLKNIRTVSTPIATVRRDGRSAFQGIQDLQQSALRLDRLNWVPLAIWPQMQATLSHQAFGRSRALLNLLLETGDDDDKPPTFFLSIFNVHDFRKQIKPLLSAFARFAQQNSNYYLLLKVSCIDGTNENINDIILAAQVNDDGEISTPLVSNNIMITTEALSRHEMSLLYDMASFYICTSYAEGQNLPLLEAMAHGVVPVSVAHTAMADYISANTAVVIPSTKGPMSMRLVQRYGIFGVETYHVKSEDVLEAVREATELSDEQYVARSQAAVEIVRMKYGTECLRQALEDVEKRCLHQLAELV